MIYFNCLINKLFYTENLDGSLNMFVQLFEEKKYLLVIIDDNLMITFTPKIFNINELK